MYTLVLLRHGESVWNKENRFTGWTDVDLTDKGIAEAKAAGVQLRDNGYAFDVAYTSVLKRAIRTLWHTLDQLDCLWLPVVRDWRLNERHYGALQGLNKAETAEKYGDEQVHIWRRSFDVPPAALSKDDSRYPKFDPRYAGVNESELPLTECLRDTINRFMPLWHDVIDPMVRSGKKVLIVAHGNTLRALVKYLDGISDEHISSLNIPTGVPLVYQLDSDMKPIKHFYLGDQVAIEAAMKAVNDQGKAK